MPPKEFAITLFVKTGSQAHIEKVKEYAERKKISFARLPRTEEQTLQTSRHGLHPAGVA